MRLSNPRRRTCGNSRVSAGLFSLPLGITLAVGLMGCGKDETAARISQASTPQPSWKSVMVTYIQEKSRFFQPEGADEPYTFSLAFEAESQGAVEAHAAALNACRTWANRDTLNRSCGNVLAFTPNAFRGDTCRNPTSFYTCLPVQRDVTSGFAFSRKVENSALEQCVKAHCQ